MNGIQTGVMQDRENAEVKVFLAWIESPEANATSPETMLAEANKRVAAFTPRMRRLAGSSLGCSESEFDAMLRGEFA